LEQGAQIPPARRRDVLNFECEIGILNFPLPEDKDNFSKKKFKMQ
jgi:hypothetical protein